MVEKEEKEIVFFDPIDPLIENCGRNIGLCGNNSDKCGGYFGSCGNNFKLCGMLFGNCGNDSEFSVKKIERRGSNSVFRGVLSDKMTLEIDN